MSDPLMKPEDFAAGFAQAVSSTPVPKAAPVIVEKPKVDAHSFVSATVPQVYWETEFWGLWICKNPIPNILSDALLQFEWGGRYLGSTVFKEKMLFTVSFNGDNRISFCEALTKNGIVCLHADVDHDYYLSIGVNSWTINRDDKRKKRQSRDQLGSEYGGFDMLRGDLDRLIAKVEILKGVW